MKTTLKKVLSMALALVLLVGVLPMGAQAALNDSCFTATEDQHQHKYVPCTNPSHYNPNVNGAHVLNIQNGRM